MLFPLKRGMAVFVGVAATVTVVAAATNLPTASALSTGPAVAEKVAAVKGPETGAVVTAAAPAVVETKDGTLASFERAKDNTIQFQWTAGNGSWAWSKWTPLPLPSGKADPFKATSAPAVVRIDDEIDLFVAGSDHWLYLNTFRPDSTHSGWSGWHVVTGTVGDPKSNYWLLSAPTVVVVNSNQLEVFFRGWSKHIVRHGTLTRAVVAPAASETVTANETKADTLADSAKTEGESEATQSAATAAPTATVTATTTNNGTASGWNAAWQNLPGEVTTGPAAVSPTPGEIDVFAVGTKKTVQQLTYANGKWGTWTAIGGAPTSPPAAYSPEPGTIVVATRQKDGATYTLTSKAGKWTTKWASLGGKSLSAPTLIDVTSSNGVLIQHSHTAFVVGTNSMVYTLHTTPDGKLTAWANTSQIVNKVADPFRVGIDNYK